jgi:co-chaperonin GroES (HSP10)
MVTYAKHAGSEIEIEGKTYLIMREGDIVAILSTLVGEHQ